MLRLIIRCRLWNDHQLFVMLSTGGGFHRVHAEPSRTWPGKGCEEEGGALRVACREGTLHCTVCHCTVTLDPDKGHISTDVGDLMTSAKGYFLYHGDHVCNNTNRVPTVRPTTWCFFHGFSDGQKIDKKSFFAQTLWLYMWKLHPIPYLCNT